MCCISLEAVKVSPILMSIANLTFGSNVKEVPLGSLPRRLVLNQGHICEE